MSIQECISLLNNNGLYPSGYVTANDGYIFNCSTRKLNPNESDSNSVWIKISNKDNKLYNYYPFADLEKFAPLSKTYKRIERR